MAADGGFANGPRAVRDHAEFADPLSQGGDAPAVVSLPTGRFRMGSKRRDPAGFSTEWPRRTVYIRRRFALGARPVTFDDYDRFAAATGADAPDDYGWGRGARPVIHVSWHDAVAYCAWLSAETGARYRLPTEAEWEYACKMGVDARFAAGDVISSHDANFNGETPFAIGRLAALAGPFVEKTTPVGSYPPNAWGLYDMHGNVCEWVQDCWFDTYDGASSSQRARHAEGAELGLTAVVRGGGWSAQARFVRSTDRWNYSREDRFEMVGFRVARDL